MTLAWGSSYFCEQKDDFETWEESYVLDIDRDIRKSKNKVVRMEALIFGSTRSLQNASWQSPRMWPRWGSPPRWRSSRGTWESRNCNRPRLRAEEELVHSVERNFQPGEDKYRPYNKLAQIRRVSQICFGYQDNNDRSHMTNRPGIFEITQRIIQKTWFRVLNWYLSIHFHCWMHSHCLRRKVFCSMLIIPSQEGRYFSKQHSATNATMIAY